MREIDIGHEADAYQIVIPNKGKLYTIDPNFGKLASRGRRNVAENHLHLSTLDYPKRRTFKALNSLMDLDFIVTGECRAYAGLDQNQNPDIENAVAFRTTNGTIILIYFYADNWKEIFESVWTKLHVIFVNLRFNFTLFPNTKAELEKALELGALSRRVDTPQPIKV